MDGVKYLREHAEKIQKSSRIVITGAGAVGVRNTTLEMKRLHTLTLKCSGSNGH
jgi:hypothetical protein